MGSIIHRGRSRPGLNHPVGETLSGGSRRRGVRDCRSAVKIDVGVGINKGSVRVDILDREAFRALGRGVPFAVEIQLGSDPETVEVFVVCRAFAELVHIIRHVHGLVIGRGDVGVV